MKRSLSLVFVGWAVLLVSPLFSAEAMRAHFINVGQADSILLEFPCGAVLIDAGAQDEKHKEHLIEYLDSFFTKRTDLKRTLDVVFVTHSHKDHTNALKDVVENFTVKNYVDDGVVEGSGKAGPMWVRKVAKEKHIRVEEVFDDRITKLNHKNGLTDEAIDPIKCEKCDPRIVVLRGGHEDFDDNLNNESLVIRVDFGESSFLFPGDAQEDEIDDLLDYYRGTPMLKADVLKVGHHGSHNATTEDYLKAIEPKIAVISVGPWTFGRNSNSRFTTYAYGHPRETTLDLLTDAITGDRSNPITVKAAAGARKFSDYDVKKKVYATAWDGDVVIRADLDGDLRTVVSDETTASFSPPIDRMSDRPTAREPSEWPATASPLQPGQRSSRRLLRRW